jgi:hypothetical protein
VDIEATDPVAEVSGLAGQVERGLARTIFKLRQRYSDRLGGD